MATVVWSKVFGYELLRDGWPGFGMFAEGTGLNEVPQNTLNMAE